MTSYEHVFRIPFLALVSLTLGACLSGSGGGSTEDQPALFNEPSVSITDPLAPEIETTDKSMILGGNASSTAGITSVLWQSDRGSQGAAVGTEQWRTEAIPLKLGNNQISVTATDSAGNTAVDKIVIRRESAGTASATLSWIPPTERADGSPLRDLAGYSIYYGRMSKRYDYKISIGNPGVATYVVENLRPGRWYFAVTALDSAGNESDVSKEAQTEIL